MVVRVCFQSIVRGEESKSCKSIGTAMVGEDIFLGPPADHKERLEGFRHWREHDALRIKVDASTVYVLSVLKGRARKLFPWSIEWTWF